MGAHRDRRVDRRRVVAGLAASPVGLALGPRPASATGGVVARRAGGAPSPPPSTVVDVGAFATDGRIDGPAIRAALAALPAAGGVVVVPPGRHEVEVEDDPDGEGPPRVADLPSHVEVRFDGAVLQVTRRGPGGEACVFRAVGVDDVRLHGVRLAGAGEAAGWGGVDGIIVAGSERVLVEDADLVGLGRGIVLGTGPDRLPARDVAVEGCTIRDCRTAGVVLEGVEHVRVRGTTVTGAPAGIRLDGTARANAAVTVESVHAAGCGVGVALDGPANRGVVVVGSTLTANQEALRAEGVAVSIVANALHRNPGPGVVAAGERLVVEANSVDHGGGGVDVDGGDAVVHANVVYNCASGLRTSPGATVARNLVEGVEV